jgi:hypothetical protein
MCGRKPCRPVAIDIRAAAVARRRPVDGNPKPHRLALRPGSEHQVQVARVESVDDAPALLIEDGIFLSDRPIPRQRPLVEPGRCRGVDVAGVLDGTAGRDEVLRPLIADIGLG